MSFFPKKLFHLRSLSVLWSYFQCMSGVIAILEFGGLQGPLPPPTFLGLTNTKNECFDWFIYIEYLLHLKSENYKYDLNLMRRIFINLEFT